MQSTSYLLGYRNAKVRTDKNNINFDKNFNPDNPPMNSFSHPEIQSKQWIRGAKDYLAGRKINQ